jgi:hypothetical protein
MRLSTRRQWPRRAGAIVWERKLGTIDGYASRRYGHWSYPGFIPPCLPQGPCAPRVTVVSRNVDGGGGWYRPVSASSRTECPRNWGRCHFSSSRGGSSGHKTNPRPPNYFEGSGRYPASGLLLAPQFKLARLHDSLGAGLRSLRFAHPIIFRLVWHNNTGAGQTFRGLNERFKG